jgi:hypothetical protein
MAGDCFILYFLVVSMTAHNLNFVSLFCPVGIPSSVAFIACCCFTAGSQV